MNFSEVLTTSYRALISLAVLFLVTKMIGKKQVSELSLFDYVIGISIGNFAAEMTINLESQEINGIVAVLIFGIVAYIVSYITMKSIYLRRFFIGVPTIIIDKGKINYKNMKKFKMDINDLLEQARINGYFDLSEIEYGIMEANGIMSFKLKDIYDTPTNKDLNINTKNIGICANIIIDGKYMKNNISNMNKNIEWVENKIKDMGYNINNILLATLNEKDEINIYLKEEMKDKEVLE
ncbi:MAG: DUF421 domain-containing protein [Bacillales bacterium]|nr:DUF421 domain-containing protein [Bacillales bacterium]